MDDELRLRVRSLLNDTEQAGYERGLREGISRLDMIAALIPASVTKAWLIEHAAREAETLGRKLKERNHNGGDVDE